MFIESDSLELKDFLGKVSHLAKEDGRIWKSPNLSLEVEKNENVDTVVFSPKVKILNDFSGIDYLEILRLELPFEELRFLRFGLNMPGDPVRFGVLDENGIQPSINFIDMNFISEDEGRITISNNSLFAFSTIDRKDVFVIGAGSFKVSEGTIVLEYDKVQKKIFLSYRTILDGLCLPSGTEKQLDNIIIHEGENLNNLLEGWAELVADACGELVPDKIPTGWNDWQFYRNEKTQEDILDSTEVLAELKQAGYPLEFVQVDGGFCLHLSEWSVPKPGFSDGIGNLADKIEKMGLKFGLWLAPYIQNTSTNVVKEHPEWLLLDSEQQPIELSSSNVGASNLIDYSLDEPFEWLRKIIRMFIDEWKVKWIKLDGPNYALYRLGTLRNRSITITEMLARTFDVIREEAGPDVLVEGEGMMGIALGRVELHRVQTDNHPRWYNDNMCNTPYAPCVYGKELIMSFLHNRWWCNHRENVILRDYPSPFCHAKTIDENAVEQIFTESEFQTQLLTAFLGSGGMLFTDPMKELKRLPHRMKYVSKLIPVWPEAAIIVDTFPDGRYPGIYLSEIKSDIEDYFILGVINWTDEIKSIEVDLKDYIGNDEYIAFSFFDQQVLAKFSEKLIIENITAHGCKLLTLKKKSPEPQVLSTSMHLVQGAIELESVTYTNQVLTLKISHFEQNDEKIFLVAPDGWDIGKVETDAQEYSLDDFDKNYPVLRFQGNPNCKTEFKIFWMIV